MRGLARIVWSTGRSLEGGVLAVLSWLVLSRVLSRILCGVSTFLIDSCTLSGSLSN